MKRILFSMLIIATFIACQNNDKQKNTDDVSNINSTETYEMSETDKSLNAFIKNYGEKLCGDNGAYSIHKIDSIKYSEYKKARWGNDTIEEKRIYWRDINKIIGNSTCYSKYVQFTFDKNAEDNSSISIKPSPYFYSNQSCYSIPLLTAISSNHSFRDMSFFECTIGIDSIGEVVMFKYQLPSKSYVHFDVSRFPNFVKNFQKKNNIE